LAISSESDWGKVAAAAAAAAAEKREVGGNPKMGRAAFACLLDRVIEDGSALGEERVASRQVPGRVSGSENPISVCSSAKSGNIYTYIYLNLRT